jgi:hypothetical protein
MIIPVSVTCLFVLALGESIWNHSMIPGLPLFVAMAMVWIAWIEGAGWARTQER